MTRDEREAFLQGLHVGIVVVPRDASAAPLASPVWYSYDAGVLTFVTGAATEKARLLADNRPVTFIAQDEAAPQRFVSFEARPDVSPGADAAERRAIARRYLPGDAIDGFLAMTPGEHLITVRLRPDRWRSSDFAKLAAM